MRAVAALLATVLMLLVLAAAVLSTEPGTLALLRLAEDLAGGWLKISAPQGGLLTGIRASRLEISTERVVVTADELSVRLAWPDLLIGRVSLVDGPRAASVLVEVRPAPGESVEDTGEPLILPLEIEAESLEIGELVVRVGDWSEQFRDIRAAAGLSQGLLTLEQARVTVREVEVSAAGNLGLTSRLPMVLELAWQARQLGLNGEGSVSGDLNRLDVEQTLHVPEELVVTAVARNLTGEPQVDALARWSAWSRELVGLGRVSSTDGRLRARWSPAAYALELVAAVDGDDLPATQLSGTATGVGTELAVERLLIEALGGQAEIRGRVALSDGTPAGELAVRGQSLGLDAWDARLPADVSLEAGARFRGAELTLKVKAVEGELRGQRVRGSGLLARRAGDWLLSDAQLQAGANRAWLEARSGKAARLSVRVEAPELDLLWPGLQGSLTGTVRAAGSLDAPELQLALEAAGLGLGEQGVAALRVGGGIDARGLGIEIRAEGIVAAGRDLGQLRVNASGPVDGHRIEAALDGPSLGLELGASGAWRDSSWRGTLQRGRIRDPRGEFWLLGSPLALAIERGRLTFGAHCWDQPPASLCFEDALVESERLVLDARLSAWPLGAFGGLLLPGMRLDGSAEALVTLRRDAGGLTGQISWQQRDTVLGFEVAPGEEVTTQLPEAGLDAEFRGDRAFVTGALRSDLGARADFRADVTDLLAEPRVQGALNLDVPDLSQLSPLIVRIADVSELRGELSGRIAVFGDPARPQVDGRLQLSGGAATIPPAGVTVEAVGISVEGREEGVFAISGSARSGPGTVLLEGQWGLAASARPGLDLHVRGEAVELARLPDGEVQVSPDLDIAWRNQQFRVGGSVTIPRARIALQRLSETRVEPSADTIVHGRETARPPVRSPFVVDQLRVVLGEEVFFEGFGLSTRLEGQLELDQSGRRGEQPLTAGGVVQLRSGQFAAFGTELKVERGALIFSGDLDDPGLEVRTSRKINYEGREITVGLLLSGKLRAIKTTVFSEPAMDEVDALSFLLTDKPLSAGAGDERFSVSSAAVGVGLSQALPLAQDLGSVVPVDELGVTGSGGEDTEFYVGENVGDDLYIQYSYGLFNKLGTVKARYRLTRRFSIEASSGEEQALDLLYSIDW